MVIQHLAKVILMKQLLIKDNQYKSKSYFSEIKDVVDCIADKTLAELEKEGVFVFPSSVRESEDLTNDQMILQISLESSLPHRDILMISQFIRLLKRERLKSRNWWQFRKHRKNIFLSLMRLIAERFQKY